MGPTENDCLTCLNSLLLQNDKCVSTCDQGFFMEAGICIFCPHTCTNCVNRMNCTSCVEGLQLQSGECKATCADGWVKEWNINKALDELQSFERSCYFENTPHFSKLTFVFLKNSSYYSDRGICVKCYLSCDTCSGPRRDQCVKCPPGWKLAAGECHPECPEGFFKTDYGCKKCHHYCKTCDG